MNFILKLHKNLLELFKLDSVTVSDNKLDVGDSDIKTDGIVEPCSIFNKEHKIGQGTATAVFDYNPPYAELAITSDVSPAIIPFGSDYVQDSYFVRFTSGSNAGKAVLIHSVVDIELWETFRVLRTLDTSIISVPTPAGNFDIFKTLNGKMVQNQLGDTEFTGDVSVNGALLLEQGFSSLEAVGLDGVDSASGNEKNAPDVVNIKGGTGGTFAETAGKGGSIVLEAGDGGGVDCYNGGDGGDIILKAGDIGLAGGGSDGIAGRIKMTGNIEINSQVGQNMTVTIGDHDLIFTNGILTDYQFNG